MNLSTKLAPISADERLTVLDVLRGFALFGILLANIEGMVGPLSKSIGGTNFHLAGADLWTDSAIYILVQGKFYALFSLLFGMGFAVMLSRAQAAGRSFVVIYLRRLLALLAIGLAHGLLLWSGDILAIYAVFGLLLLLFRKTPQSRLPKWGLLLYLAPVGLVLLFGALASMLLSEPTLAAEFSKELGRENTEMQTSIEAQRQAYGSGTYSQMITQAAVDLQRVWGYMLFMGWQILGLFVLGTWFVRSGAVRQPDGHARLFKRLRRVGFPTGLALMLWSFWIMPEYEVGRVNLLTSFAVSLNMTGSLLMSLGYFSWIVGGMQSSLWARRLSLLAPAGRMALTNYLGQSLICTLIFYSHGLGFYEQLPRAWQVPLVVVLFAMQVVFSRWWLSHFRFGPMEWLWRALTYLQFPPMRNKTRTPDPAAAMTS